VLWGAVSRAWTPYPATVAAATRTYLQLLAMVWLIHEYAPGWAEQRRVLQAFVLGTLVSSASTIATYLQGAAGPFYQRYAAEGFDPNDLCVIFALSIPMSVYFGLAERSRMVWIWRLHPIPVLIAAALTASRGGFVAIAVSLLTIPALLPRLPLMRKLAAVLFLAGACAAVVAVAPESSFERIATLPGDAGSRSLGDRVPIWRAGLEVYREHPVLGTGLGTFAEAVQPVLGYAVVAHNVFLTLLAETGLAGAGLFLLALGSLVRDVTRFPPVDRRLWSIVLLTWLAGSFSLSWAHRKPTWFLFAMIAARAVSLRSEQGGGGND
jgi:O-antigen ligase